MCIGSTGYEFFGRASVFLVIGILAGIFVFLLFKNNKLNVWAENHRKTKWALIMIFSLISLVMILIALSFYGAVTKCIF